MSVLKGVRIVEMEGIGPGPMAAMLLWQLGAEVITIGRPGAPRLPVDHDFLSRGRPRMPLDLKNSLDLERARTLIAHADILIEGYRPGVCERLGIGPDECLRRNPRLIYGRMTGWGQTGPLAGTAGHDINYLAMSGALHAIGTAERPVPPLNLVGDFGGGALYLALGIACALFERSRSGKGQVVDAAIIDGTASLLSMFHGLVASGEWVEQRASNLLDGGSPVYDVYVTRDGGHVAVGCLEPQFYDEMITVLGIRDKVPPPGQHLAAKHREALRRALADAFRQRSRDEWAEVFAGTDACVSPVLSMAEAARHPHNQARGMLKAVDGAMSSSACARLQQNSSRRRVEDTGRNASLLGCPACRRWAFQFGSSDVTRPRWNADRPSRGGRRLTGRRVATDAGFSVRIGRGPGGRVRSGRAAGAPTCRASPHPFRHRARPPRRHSR